MSSSAPRFPHQIAAVEALIDNPAMVLGFRCGRGKSRVSADLACDLYSSGVIDTLVVVAPASLRSIWADPDPVLGELSKWAWQPHTITEYHAKTHLSAWRPEGLAVVVTNPEYLRHGAKRRRTGMEFPNLDPLTNWLRGRRTLLVLDESWLYKSPKSLQTKAIYLLRQKCQRVVLLNGTLGEPAEQYSQFMIADANIFDRMDWWTWRSRFCQMGGFKQKQIVGYTNMEEYAQRTAPYVLLDDGGDDFARVAPPTRTQIEVTLKPSTWKVYEALRKDFVAWLSETETATALQAGVRALRLAQITSGFVGGIEVDEDLLDQKEASFCSKKLDTVREVGREKLDALVAFLTDEGVPSKVLIFTRFRPDVERTVRVLAEAFPNHRVLPLYGSQDADERREAKRLLAPDGPPEPAIIVANAQSGGAGLNLTAASLCIFLANDYALKTRVQAEGRVDRTGQTQPVRFVDFLAVGPAGQKTIDHVIVSTLRNKQTISFETLKQWGLTTPALAA